MNPYLLMFCNAHTFAILIMVIDELAVGILDLEKTAPLEDKTTAELNDVRSEFVDKTTAIAVGYHDDFVKLGND